MAVMMQILKREVVALCGYAIHLEFLDLSFADTRH